MWNRLGLSPGEKTATIDHGVRIPVGDWECGTERWKGVFVFTFTTIVMAVPRLPDMGKQTGSWGYFAIYTPILGFIIGKFWDYRPPD